MEDSQNLVVGQGMSVRLEAPLTPLEALHKVRLMSQIKSRLNLRKGYSINILSVEIDNLFFRTDDGRVLAVRIRPTLGPELLRGLSKQIGPLTQLSALPFAMAPSVALDDHVASHGQSLSLTANASTVPSTSAHLRQISASISTNKSAPVLGAPAASSSNLSFNSGTGSIDTDACIDGILSSAVGRPYNRDWISENNVNEGVLRGIPSKHKLDLLVRHSAVVASDKLCVT